MQLSNHPDYPPKKLTPFDFDSDLLLKIFFLYVI